MQILSRLRNKLYYFGITITNRNEHPPIEKIINKCSFIEHPFIWVYGQPTMSCKLFLYLYRTESQKSVHQNCKIRDTNPVSIKCNSQRHADYAIFFATYIY